MKHPGIALTALLLVVPLAACGQSTGRQPSARLATTSAPPATTSAPPAITSALPATTSAPPATAATPPATVSAASVGLQVVSVDGPTGGPPGGVRCPLWTDRIGQVVLASGGTRLSDAQVGRLKQQADAFWPEPGAGAPSNQVPDGLRRVPGVETSGPMPWPPRGPGFFGTNFIYGPGCAIELQLTNTGRGTIQVPGAGFALTRTPESNSQHYDLVDRCSVVTAPPVPCHPQLGGGPAECSVYTAQVQMASASAGAVFSDSPVSAGSSGPCPTLTVAPAATIVLWIDAVSPSPLVYSVMPILTVDSAAGRRLVSLQDLVGTMAFAAPSQFSCWKLVGNTFVKALDGADVLPQLGASGTVGFDGWERAGVWCA